MVWEQWENGKQAKVCVCGVHDQKQNQDYMGDNK